MISMLWSVVEAIDAASPFPWYVDMFTTIATLSLAWRKGGGRVVRGTLRATWNFLVAVHKAIDAAPEIARLLGEAVELIRGDVLKKLNDGADHFKRHDEAFARQGDINTDHETRIADLERKGRVPEEVL